jgi:hypothetical protein
MRGHIESIIHITYPRIDLGTARPQYPRLTIGDVRGWFPFQDHTVAGYFADGEGGNELWRAHGAWGGRKRGSSKQWDRGKTEKMQLQLWFELGHKKWPDAGFDYFLAQMRRPDQDKYYPTLLFGLDPIDPAKARPPAAPSAVHPQRGLVMLRAEEGPGHWESAAPAVGMRLTTNYAHNVNDSLALVGYYALNRPIYMNPKSDPGYAFGFSRSVRSHCGVMVDGHVKVEDWGRTGSLEPQFTDDCTTRHAFGRLAKFVAARTAKRYPGVDETRALYLLDAFSCSSGRPRWYAWIVHTIGKARPDRTEGWEASSDLAETIKELTSERSVDAGGKAWSITTRQVPPAAEPADTPLSQKWFARKIGVRMTMLGEDGTKAYLTDTPRPRSAKPNRPAPRVLVDGVTILASRKASRTAFVSLHEPFEGEPRIDQFRRIAQGPQAVGVAVGGREGSGVNDRVMLRIGDGHERPATLSGTGESFTFANYAFVRIGTDKVEASGDLRAMKLKVSGRPRLLVNGKRRDATITAGVMTFGN